MAKRFKLIVSMSVIALVSLLAIWSTVFANSTTYASTLRMDGNSTLTGSTRTYNQRNHRISIYPKYLSGNTNMYVSLNKKGWFGSTNVQSTDMYMTETYKTYSQEMGNHDTGDYYYYFSTFGQGHYGAINADPVYMVCYD